MLGSFLAGIGSNIGKYFGGGILSSIGRYAGKYAGNFFERKWFHKKEVFEQYANLKESFNLSLASYGTPIPLIFGKNRIAGKIIWTDKIKNIEETTSSTKYFTEPRQVQSTSHYTEYKYTLSFAMCICEGEIKEVSRIWNGNELINISQYKFRLYKGISSQMPDPCINFHMNGNAPAFRDLAYIVFEDLPLADFNDIIPNLSFEVTRKANVPGSNTVEDYVTSMVMIPGSGEYVYDTIIQTKQILSHNGSVKCEKIINSHNLYNIPNSIHSLNQLQDTCQNIKWIAPVVCWFGDSLDLNRCKIRPAVEFKDEYAKFSEEWRVGKYNRDNAYEITKDKDNNPRYGGSVNDASIARYLQELKARNLKIMFYPMFFLDLDQKPWRGHLTGAAHSVSNFFNQEGGYNEFIIHYAHLVKDYVDAFIIGSELIGLTKIKDDYNNFPAVNELIKLAEKVKQILGNNVLVSYAADWSEYHHTDGGWFNLDPLWASSSIDFIGIDAYFPITESTSFISNEDLKHGFSSGEGYDYYIDRLQKQRVLLDKIYAWKDLKYWWENTHTNPDNNITQWRAKSKKIWFTEYGFPSIDKASNQPNVFFDPLCLDGGVPIHSNGEIDFALQRRCIRAFIEFWGREEYIDNMFLWTWDARPYPAWPHMDVWRDGYLWEKGHWVNNKFGMCSVASIILEISYRCRIDLQNVETTTIDEVVDGTLFNHQTSGMEAINMLRSAYFFDICASTEHKISFIKRGLSSLVAIDGNNLVKFSANSYIKITNIAQEEILTKVDIYFQNQLIDYRTNHIHINSDKYSNVANAALHLPLVLSVSEAAKIGRLLLLNAATENKVIEFKLPISHFDLEAGDYIILKYQTIEYHLRIISNSFSGLEINVRAIIDNIDNYHHTTLKHNEEILHYKESIRTQFRIVELPFKLYNYDFPYIAIYLNSDIKLPLYVKIKDNAADDDNDSWNKITMLKATNSITKIVEFNCMLNPNFFLIDEVSVITVSAENISYQINNNWKLAEINNEIIAFKHYEKIEENIYSISCLIRGAYGTEQYAKYHGIGSALTLLSPQTNILPISLNLIGRIIEFKVGALTQTQEIYFTNQMNNYSLPIITVNYIKENILYLKWVVRNFQIDGWGNSLNKIPAFIIKLTVKDKSYYYKIIQEESQTEIDLSNIDISDDYEIAIITDTN